MRPGIGLIGLGNKFEVGYDKIPGILEKVQKNMDRYDIDITLSETIMHDDKSVNKCINFFKDREVDILTICIGTWSEDHLLIDFLDEIKKPLVLWSFPAYDTGSLCGMHQICSVFKELDIKYRTLYSEPDDQSKAKELYKIARAYSLVNEMNKSRIGSICGRVEGMTEVACDEFELKRIIGPRLINLGFDKLEELFDDVKNESASTKWQEVKKQILVDRVKVSEDDGITAMKYYYALKDIIEEYKLDGITAKCYPDYMGKVCLPYSLLSEEGIVCGCEGDINSTAVMKMLYELTEMPVHNTDLLYTDYEKNSMLYSHCGSGGFSLAESQDKIELGNVRLANSGVCALFPARPGEVTLCNLVGRRDTYRMTVIKGKAVQTEMLFPGNPIDIVFEQDLDTILECIAEEGVGHHWMVGYGDLTRELKLYSEIVGLRYIGL